MVFLTLFLEEASADRHIAPFQVPCRHIGYMTKTLTNYAVEAVRLNSFVVGPLQRNRLQKCAKARMFFYAGIGDSVKCFFCDGGLRTWEPGDDPWREHARWFAKCPYVRQVKGPEFIAAASRNANANAARTRNDNKKNRTLGSKGEKQAFSKGKACTVDPRHVSARMDRPIVRTVLDMGIPREAVQKTIERHLRETGDDFSSAEALLEAVFANQNSEQNETEAVASEASSSTCSGKTEMMAEITAADTAETEKLSQMEEEELADTNEDTESLLEENRQLKEQRQCRICMDAEVNVVFLPCGHLVCCTACAPAMRKCPICRGNIRGTVRTFLS
ncbi:baculoviral IAP repeat-containing protein 2-like [Gigantopelta aegis]|uniref:baculoviral IAP repeat-containing protein 2-like n=1 Tax=Gigantopelta aegis TaxID=1735272 RepID=UPI001B88BFC6|nr:baculoviral IAP repeat-containing protein 2-like [Gigantopelta aegis]